MFSLGVFLKELSKGIYKRLEENHRKFRTIRSTGATGIEPSAIFQPFERKKLEIRKHTFNYGPNL